MRMSDNKVMDLSEAIQTYVPHGCHLSIGGFTINRNPMAAIHEIIRQEIKDLHLYVHSNGQGVDELIGAKSVSRLEIAYGGTGKFMSTCIRFRLAIEREEIQVEDYSNYMMTLRFLAGSMGIPFMPVRSGFGTDIMEKWGFPPEFREADGKIPNKKLVAMDNPFEGWLDTDKVVLVPAIRPETTIIHVQKADVRGNCRIRGLSFADAEQAKASEHLIITCEELVDADGLKDDPDLTCIPFIHADAVVHVPNGAFPTACYGHYDYDSGYMNAYAKVARDDEAYAAFMQERVFQYASHQEMLDHLEPGTLERIAADPIRGYAVDLDRTN
ncbi:MAG: CoA transferase subunit A [Desulfobacterales bacterium]|nr:CoA transferase subunit A [Desulfobacterales bacterium]